MRAWVTDGDEFIKNGDINSGDLITTNRINEFLKNNNINILISPKGFGKTILLIYKRLLYTMPETEFIPSDIILDIPNKSIDYKRNKLNVEVCREEENWRMLWRVCISLPIIQIIKKYSVDEDPTKKEDYTKLEMIRRDKDDLHYPQLRKLIYNDEINDLTPHGYFSHILTKFDQNDIISLLDEQEIIDRLMSEINTKIVIFIDNVDEIFNEFKEQSKKDENTLEIFKFDNEIWHECQHGLIYAVLDLCNQNSNLNIFVAIRQEAYEKLEYKNLENIRGKLLNIHYSQTQLKKIFEQNIRLTDTKYLIKPEKKTAQPIYSFLGFTKIINNSTGEEEDIFDYIYRHTLKRPRDIVFIGERIRDVENEDRTEQNIQNVINTAAEDIAIGYFNAFYPHTCFGSILNVRAFFNLIPHNILKLEHLKSICSKFNGGCNNKCEMCHKKHGFCDLYKLGLLGTVECNQTDNEFKQQFLRPGEKTFEHRCLPTAKHKYSDYYLIHPILNGLIGKYPEKRTNHTITIGDNKKWTEPVLPDFITEIVQTSDITSPAQPELLQKIEIEGIKRAIELSKNCKPEDGKIHPKVGAVIIKDNQIICEAYRGEIDSGDHAEYTALIKKCGQLDLTGATLIATLEPCTSRKHDKKPCAQHIIEKGIKKVIMGMIDPNNDIRGKGWLYLQSKNVHVELFPYEYHEQVRRLNSEFLDDQCKNYKFDLMKYSGSDSDKYVDDGKQDFDDVDAQRIRIFEVLNKRLNDEEIKTFCAIYLKLDYEEFDAQTRSGRIRELINHYERKDTLITLIEGIKMFELKIWEEILT